MGPNQPPHYNPSYADASGVHGIIRSASHSRDASGARGRVLASSGINSSIPPAQKGGTALSPRSQSSNPSPVGLSSTIERRPSLTQNHHRHASKAHGLFGHSRNASLVHSPATSPLSPFVPPSNGTNAVPEFSSLTMHQNGYKDPRMGDSPSNTSNLSSASTLIPNQEVADQSTTGPLKKRPERSGGNPTRRIHGHHRSQSKHQHAHKPQNVTEWTIYHLFVSVSHSAPTSLDR